MNAQLLLATTKTQLLLFGAKKAANDVGTSDKGFSGLLNNLSKTVESWGNYVLIFVGIVLIAFGAIALFKAVKGLGGQQGPSGMDWAKAVLAIIIGILLSATTIGKIKHNDHLNSDTINDALNGNG